MIILWVNIRFRSPPPRFRDHVTPIFQPTPISDPGPHSSWASTCLPGRGRSCITGLAGISGLGRNSEPRGNNRSFPETRERDRRAANLWNIISVFCWKNFRILSNFSVSLNLFLTKLKTFMRQLPIYSGGTHPLPVETLVDSFGTTGTGSEARKRVTTTCGREKIECFGD